MERKVSLDDKSPETISMLADVFDDLQNALEPIRDKALDERSRLVGYAQCAEQMIKIIADQVAGLRAMALKKRDGTTIGAVESAPVAPKNGRSRAKATKETIKGGDNSA
jgi:hypothetical protein